MDIGVVGYAQEPTRDEGLIVSTTSIQISAARQMREMKRKEIILRNIATAAIGDVITIVCGNQIATANAGIILNPGDVLTMSEASADSWIYQGVINAICNQVSAIKNLSVYER